MIHTIKGDLLSIERGFIVHGCNAQGLWGSGIAKQIKDKWPGAFEKYVRELNLMKAYSPTPLGSYSMYYASDPMGDDLAIINMITQDRYGHGGRYVNYAAVAKGFMELFANIREYDDLSVNFPLIGAGLGGGDWNTIKQIIQDSDPMDRFQKNLWVLDKGKNDDWLV